jgi:signal peptidase II
MTDEPRPSHRLYALTIGLAALVIIVDQASKVWAESALADGKVIPLIGDLLRFQLVYNPGAAFSIGTGFTWVFAIIAAIIVVMVAWYSWRVQSKAWAILFGLVLGGAATHLGDRLFRAPSFAQGHVVDFIGYGDLFIGNIADIAIVGAAVYGVVLIARGVKMIPETSETDAS